MCCFGIFVLKSIVGVRGFVICFEIGKGHCFCFEMFVWVERFFKFELKMGVGKINN